METAVILLNFGEPEDPAPEVVAAYLERIFLANATLEPGRSEEDRRRRSRELAERRTPGLIEDYRRIGGSPLNRQARGQAEALQAELARRGCETSVLVGMQFTDPSIGDAVRRARAGGARSIVGLPVYPLCGASTTVAALEELSREVRADAVDVALHEISGWHTHPEYVRLRAEAVRAALEAARLDLADPRTLLYFSAHGTPLRYVEDGPRYDRYVEESCRLVADALGSDRYAIGFQNHGNRRIRWTEPANEELVERVDADRLVIVPISFMHEQSETLVELDDELRERVEARGMEFHRVPVPHDDPRFVAVLADLVVPLLAGGDPGTAGLGPCRCRRGRGTLCLNAGRPA